MSLLIRIMIFAFVLCFTRISMAAAGEAIPPMHSLSKKDLSKIKFVGKDYDRVHMYLTDKKQKKYRIPELTQDEAKSILNRFEAGSELVFESIPVDKREYEEITRWQ